MNGWKQRRGKVHVQSPQPAAMVASAGAAEATFPVTEQGVTADMNRSFLVAWLGSASGLPSRVVVSQGPAVRTYQRL